MAFAYVTVLLPTVARYKRILCVGSEGITTHNPSSLEVTNQWLYKDIISVTATLRSNAQNMVSLYCNMQHNVS